MASTTKIMTTLLCLESGDLDTPFPVDNNAIQVEGSSMGLVKDDIVTKRVVRNRNKYYDNNSDGAENPFWATPLRSPLDNLMISVGLNYRFNKQGFEAWKPRPKKEKNREVFKFGL